MPVTSLVPTPQTLMVAPCCLRLAMICSSRSLLPTMAVRGKPASSRILRAWMLRKARSPESSRIPASSWPCSRSRRPISHRVPHAFQRIVGVHQEDAVVGHRFGVGRERFQLGVEGHHPTMRMGAFDRDAKELAGQHIGGAGAAADVGCAAGGQAAIDPLRPAQAKFDHRFARAPPGKPAPPWSQSAIGSSGSSASAVSTICAWSIGPWTRSNGSWGKTTVPSGMASTSQSNRSWRR